MITTVTHTPQPGAWNFVIAQLTVGLNVIMWVVSTIRQFSNSTASKIENVLSWINALGSLLRNAVNMVLNFIKAQKEHGTKREMHNEKGCAFLFRFYQIMIDFSIDKNLVPDPAKPKLAMAAATYGSIQFGLWIDIAKKAAQ